MFFRKNYTDPSAAVGETDADADVLSVVDSLVGDKGDGNVVRRDAEVKLSSKSSNPYSQWNHCPLATGLRCRSFTQHSRQIYLYTVSSMSSSVARLFHWPVDGTSERQVCSLASSLLSSQLREWTDEK